MHLQSFIPPNMPDNLVGSPEFPLMSRNRRDKNPTRLEIFQPLRKHIPIFWYVLKHFECHQIIKMVDRKVR